MSFIITINIYCFNFWGGGERGLSREGCHCYHKLRHILRKNKL